MCLRVKAPSMSSSNETPIIMTISRASRHHHACKPACLCRNGENSSPLYQTKASRTPRFKCTRRNNPLLFLLHLQFSRLLTHAWASL